MDLIDSLLRNHLFLMSLTVGLGIMIGKITIRGISFGISGALFVGLFIGAFGYSVPNDYFTWNLMFFVVAVGLLAAEDTARVIRRYGVKFVILSVAVTGAGALTTYAMARLFSGSASPHLIAGTYTGALTSSPGLGAALEATGGNPDVTIGYSVAYPFGVMAVVLFVQLVPAIFRIDVAKEKEKLAMEKAASLPVPEDGGPGEGKRSHAFSLLSFVFCIIGGSLLGRISVPLGALGSISLGATGGGLLFALAAGSFERIGPFAMKMDKNVLSAIRAISLGFFLAIVGLNAGGGVVKAFMEHGMLLIAVGIGAALAAEMTGFILGYYVWKINWIILAGAICGAMTSTPGLGAAIDATGTDEVSAGYGAAYPPAIVCMVLFTTMLHTFFN
ncbi:MAG: YidE/YbjL duplication [Aminivibrio sp.]